MTMNSNALVINTGLTDDISLQVLMNTLGQLSDGIWENSRNAERYWPFAEAKMIKGNVCLVINNNLYKDQHYANGFRLDLKMDPIRIKDYFAKKVQAVVRTNNKDCPNKGIKCTAKCEAPLDYMSHYTNPDVVIRACDAYKVYDALRNKTK